MSEGRILDLKEALGLALDILGRNEPGDSRAVSNEFVAMLAILDGAGDIDASLSIIKAARERVAAMPPPEPPEVKVTEGNATFYTFKTSGKYYTHGRGYVPKEVFEPLEGGAATREALLKANGNKVPGLSTTGSNFHLIVVLDEDVDYGWPLHLNAMDG
jgi:hypothetical protein